QRPGGAGFQDRRPAGRALRPSGPRCHAGPGRYLARVIMWLYGGFGAGKTTLAEELHRRLPDAVVYDPEDVGLMLWKWMRPNGDFQHFPSGGDVAGPPAR